MVDIPTPSMDNQLDTLSQLPPAPMQTLPMQSQDTAPTAPDTSSPGLMDRTLGVLKAPEHILGQTLGKVVSNLSGSHNEYAVDPATGQTVATPVRETPGQTFRSILALGLMGGQGIGPQHGQMNFTQGLLAGLGGGAKEAQDRKDLLDQKARAQAQQDYANKLKADEAARQQRQLTINEQLSRAQIANFNQEQAARKIVMDTQAYNLSRQQAIDSAEPYVQMANMRIAADKPKVDGFSDLGIDPIASVPQSELGKYIDDNPGHASKYMALQTGIKQTFNPATHAMQVEDIYSIYPKATKVSPALMAGLESIGANKPGSRLSGLYSTLSRAQKADAEVPIGTILTGYRQFTDWNKILKDAEDTKLRQAQIQHEQTSTWLEGLDAQLKTLGLSDAKEQKEAKDLFTKYYDETTHTLLPQAAIDLNPNAKDKDGKDLYNPKQKEIIQRKANILKSALDGMYEVGMKDGFDRNKFVKDGNGNIVSSDASSGYMLDMIHGYGQASGLLTNGFKPQPTAGNLQGITNPQVLKTIAYYAGQNITDPSVITAQLTSKGIPTDLQAQVLQGLGIKPVGGGTGVGTEKVNVTDKDNPGWKSIMTRQEFADEQTRHPGLTIENVVPPEKSPEQKAIEGMGSLPVIY